MADAAFPYRIGIDGGGSQSRARLESAAGDVLGEGRAGPGNIRRGTTVAWGNIMAAIDAAIAAAGLDRAILPVTSLGMGLAGVTGAEDGDRFLRAGPRFGAARVVSDAHTACLGAFAGGDGAILIAGTGCAGHLALSGDHREVFGWGFVAADGGSAAVLGRDAVELALDVADGLAPRRAFADDILQVLGGTRSAIIDWVTTASPKEFGALAPRIFEHAAAGDTACIALLRSCASRIETMIVRLGALGAPGVCLMGGLGDPIRPWLAPAIATMLREPLHDAVWGGLRLTYQDIGDIAA